MKHLKKIDEYYGGGEEYKHNIENVDLDRLMDRLDILYFHDKSTYNKFFRDIMKENEENTGKDSVTG